MFDNKKRALVAHQRLPDLNERISYVANGIKTSSHWLKGGDEDPCFVDFDKIAQEPMACKAIGDWFLFVIDSIKAENRNPDFIAFIEKEGIGTIGAISFSAYLSIRTSIPHIFYRENRRLFFEKIKMADKYKVSDEKKLSGKSILIISDVSTTGDELKNTISSINKEGGTVNDVILYFSRLNDESLLEFEDKNINMHFLLNQSIIRKYAYDQKTKEAVIIRDIFNKIDKAATYEGPVLPTVNK